MQHSPRSIEMFHESSVDEDEISPSITIRRNRRMRSGAVMPCDLLYTENLWAPSNNTLAGCTEFDAWQSASQWVIVTDDSYNGLASVMLQGCETISAETANVLLVTPKRLTETLLSMNSKVDTVVVLAIDSASIDNCAKQLDLWIQAGATNDSMTSTIHLLWLPTDRASQTLPANTLLESLPWLSLTVICDLANLPSSETDIKLSTLIMLRAAVFIDAQLIYWLEGNLSAMAEADRELHKTAIMRAVNTIFTVKRRRSDEPDVPMAFTDTAALRYTHPVSDAIPQWQVQARQLMLDILYAKAASSLPKSEVDRITRVMDSLGLLEASRDASVLDIKMPQQSSEANAYLLLKELGTATYSREFMNAAWNEINA